MNLLYKINPKVVVACSAVARRVAAVLVHHGTKNDKEWRAAVIYRSHACHPRGLGCLTTDRRTCTHITHAVKNNIVPCNMHSVMSVEVNH